MRGYSYITYITITNNHWKRCPTWFMVDQSLSWAIFLCYVQVIWFSCCMVIWNIKYGKLFMFGNVWCYMNDERFLLFWFIYLLLSVLVLLLFIQGSLLRLIFWASSFLWPNVIKAMTINLCQGPYSNNYLLNWTFKVCSVVTFYVL